MADFMYGNLVSIRNRIQRLWAFCVCWSSCVRACVFISRMHMVSLSRLFSNRRLPLFLSTEIRGVPCVGSSPFVLLRCVRRFLNLAYLFASYSSLGFVVFIDFVGMVRVSSPALVVWQADRSVLFQLFARPMFDGRPSELEPVIFGAFYVSHRVCRPLRSLPHVDS